jgi:hypothetical protein
MWEPVTAAQGGSALPGDEEWPTPTSLNRPRTDETLEKCAAFRKRNANQNSVPLYLEEVAQRWPEETGTMWMTPSVVSATGQEYTRDGGVKGQERLALPGQAKEMMSQWPTPRTITGGKETAERKQELGRVNAGGGDLQAAVEMWPTPAARDAKGANSVEHVTTNGTGRMHMDQLANFVEHSHSSPQAQQIPDGQESSPSTDTSRRRLNPAFGCLLMGWSWWWTNPGITSCVKSEMVSYRSKLQSHLSSLLGEPESN